MSEKEKMVRSCLQGLGSRFKVFFNARKKDPVQAGWQETEAEYQARQRTWLQKKGLSSGENAGPEEDA
ncbi:MAG: hypothetical protein R6U22_07995 [Desulfohalobiaceae bacterium]